MAPSPNRIRALPGCAQIKTFEIPCDAGHDVVYALATGRGSEIYLAASNEFCPGLCAAMFAFDTAKETFRRVIDVQEATGFDPASGLIPHCKVHLSLSSTADGRAFAATHFTAPAVGQKGFESIAAYRDGYPGCHLLEYDPRKDRTINHGVLVRGEGARVSCLDRGHLQYYFVSYPRNHLWRYDIGQRRLYDLGRVGQENSFGLECDDEGNVYTSDDLGEILCYRRQEDRIEETGLFLPLAPPRRPNGNYIRRMTRGLDGAFYGVTNKGARLFRFDPRARSIHDYGVIFGSERNGAGDICLPPCKALAQVDDHTLLLAFGGDGIYPGDEQVADLVAFNLAEERSTWLGKFVCPRSGIPAWIAQCALYVPEAGAVYFGMQQAVERLRLWRVPAESSEQPVARHAARLLERHHEVIARQPFGASVEGRSDLPFLKQGYVQLHELGWRGEHRIIPAGETGISDLCFASEDALYGVTSGRHSHLFAFRPYRQNRFTENYDVHPWDLGLVFPEPMARARLHHDSRGNRLLVMGETNEGRIQITAFPPGAEQERYRAVFHSLPHWQPVAWDVSPFTLLHELDRESVSLDDLAYMETAGIFVGVGRSGALVWVAQDNRVHAVSVAGLAPIRFLRSVGAGSVIAWTDGGTVLSLDFSPGGRAAVAAVHGTLDWQPRCHAVATGERWVAIGGNQGQLTMFDLRGQGNRLETTLPRPWPVRALAWRGDRFVYGFYGEDGMIGEAFRYDAATGRVCEIGILQNSTAPRYWMCHRCDSMTVGRRGEVYFGENDRVSHLFTFIDSQASFD